MTDDGTLEGISVLRICWGMSDEREDESCQKAKNIDQLQKKRECRGSHKRII